MPTGYLQYCNSTATTTNYYVPTQWTTSSASITQTNQWYQPTYTTQNVSYNTSYRWVDEVWQQWVVQVNHTQSYIQTSSGLSRAETPEERAERHAQEQRRHDERVAARTRARVLLEEFLDEGQKVELEQKGRFHVTGSRGRRYCIRTSGQAGNVDLLKPDGSLQATLCCHPRGSLPDGDAWLMQMVEIRHDEDHFLRTANVHRGVLPAAA